MSTNLLLCNPDDTVAHWLAREITSRGVPLECVTPDAVALAKCWTQNLTTQHDHFKVELSDGRYFDETTVGLVINRVQYLQLRHWRYASSTEANYAREEISAAMLSWLHMLSSRTQVFNPPAPNAFWGFVGTDAQWRTLAFSHGLPVADVHSNKPVPAGEIVSFLVVGDKVHAPLKSAELSKACLDVSKACGMPLLEVQFGRSGKHLKFIRGNTLPDLRRFSPTVLNLILQHAVQRNS